MKEPGLTLALALTLTAATASGQTPSIQWIGNPRTSVGDLTAGPDGNIWFTEPFENRIGRITPGGIITEFPIPTPDSDPWGIAAGPDGNLWITEVRANRIARMTPAGVVTEFQVPGAHCEKAEWWDICDLSGIAAGPDGNLWFTMFWGGIGRITPSGIVSVFDTMAYGNGGVYGSTDITRGPGGNLWFTASWSLHIGEISPEGKVTAFPTQAGSPLGITSGPDGNVWYVDNDVPRVFRMNPDGVETTFPLPWTDGYLRDMAAGPDGNLWFVDGYERLGRITPSGVVTEFRLPSPMSGAWAIAVGPDGLLWFTDDAGIHKVDVNPPPGCQIACSATAPSFVDTSGAVPFQGSATAVGCSKQPVYRWTFGDGGTADLQNPSHSYSSPGSYVWSMTATADGASCRRGDRIWVENSSTVRLERIDDIRSPLELVTRPGDEWSLYFALKKASGEPLPASSFSYDVVFSGATPAASGIWTWSVEQTGIVKLTLRPDGLTFASDTARLTFPPGEGLVRVDGTSTTLANALPDVVLRRLPNPYRDLYDVYAEGSAGASGIVGVGAGAGAVKASLAVAKLSVKGSGGIGFRMELGPDGGLALERRVTSSLAGSLEAPSVELKAIGALKVKGPSMKAGLERGGEVGQRIEYAGKDVLSDEARVTNTAFFLETASLSGGLIPSPYLGPILRAAITTSLRMAGASDLVDGARRETWVSGAIGGSLSAQAVSVEIPVASRDSVSSSPLRLSLGSIEGVFATRSGFLYSPSGQGTIFDGLENRWTLAISGSGVPSVWDVQLRRIFGDAWLDTHSYSVSAFGRLDAAGSLREAGVDLSGQPGTGGDIGLFRSQDYNGSDVRIRIGNTAVLGALRNEEQAQLAALAGDSSRVLTFTSDECTSTARHIVDRAEAVAPSGIAALLAETDRRNGRVLSTELDLDFELSAGLGLGLSLGFSGSWEQARLVENAARTCRADGRSWDLLRNQSFASWRNAPSFQALLTERVLSGVGPLIQKAFQGVVGRIVTRLGSLFDAPGGHGLLAYAPLNVEDPTTGRRGGWAEFPEGYRGWTATLGTGDPSRPEAYGAPGAGPSPLRWAYTTREVFEGPHPASRRAALEMGAASTTRLTLIGNFVSLELKPDGGAAPDALPYPVTLGVALYADQATGMGADPARIGEARLFRYDEGSGAWQVVGGSLGADQASVSGSIQRRGLYAPGIVTTIPAGDSDGDGLVDSEEDKDGDGIVDPGESEPYAWDSDGDGVNDAEERRSGTDPLDGASVPNRAPTLGYVSSRTARVGEVLTIALRATDPDGDPLAFSAQGLPPGATLNPQTGAFGFSPQQAGKWRISFTVTDAPRTGSPLADTQTMVVEAQRIASDGDLTTFTRALPIVLDVYGANASHYTTELTLTNRGSSTVAVTYRYQAAIGDPAGSGAAPDSLAPGEQRTIPNVLSYLRSLGLAIPMAATAGSQGGVLLVKFEGAESEETVAATARTTTPTISPHPAGAAGLSYAGTPPLTASQSKLTIYGLRDSAQDRANVAVFNMFPEAVTVRMTAFAGDATGHSAVVRDSLAIPAFGWTQASNVFSGTGITNGWVTVQRTSSTGRFGAYGVVNDNATNDGSFVQSTSSAISGNRLTVPVLVETSTFRSELVLVNSGSTTASFTLRYVESLTPALGSGGTVTVSLRAREQRIIPEAIEFLRRQGMAIGAMGAGSYAGALRVNVSGASLADVFAGARTAASSPAGGQFGLFTPGMYESETAGTEAFIYGLRADATSRSNLAVVHAGGDGDDGLTLEIQVFDGDHGSAPAGAPLIVSLASGRWEQLTGILGAKGVRNGWVRVRRTAGTSPWIAYGVVNDGANPGERTGDGAYVSMVTSDLGSPQVTIREYPTLTPQSGPVGLTVTNDGNIWFGEPGAGRLGYITPSGVVREFPIPYSGPAAPMPWGLTTGTDGNVWFTDINRNSVGRMSSTGAAVAYPIPSPACLPMGITSGPDGNLWFVEAQGDKVGRLTQAGELTEFDLPTTGRAPMSIVTGPDGNLWIAAYYQIIRMNISGVVTGSFPVSQNPFGIARGPDGALWFTEQTKVGRIATDGTLREYSMPTDVDGAQGIAAGGDGNLWIAVPSANKLLRVTPGGIITAFSVPTAESNPTSVVLGQDGSVWFTEPWASQIGRVTFAP